MEFLMLLNCFIFPASVTHLGNYRFKGELEFSFIFSSQGDTEKKKKVNKKSKRKMSSKMQYFLLCYFQDSDYQNICIYIRDCMSVSTVPQLVKLLFCHFCLCPSVVVQLKVFFSSFFSEISKVSHLTLMHETKRKTSFR